MVEVKLVAGLATKQYVTNGPAQVWAFRDGARAGAAGSVPGPLLEVQQGDTVRVHFRNELPEPTTIHWHGVRVPNIADGSPAAQQEVAPGAEFVYEFVARDAGTFWYHPHVHGDVQVERGLYGMVVVHGGPAIAVDAERHVVLDDVKLAASGALSPETTSDDVMLGRVGTVLLANGNVDSTMDVSGGSRERWRIVNAANGRYFNLRLPGHAFRVIGWDGGLLETPYLTETLLITPGERYEVLVELHGEVGTELALETIHYDRGHGMSDPGPQAVLKLRFDGEHADSATRPLPSAWGRPVDLTPPPNATARTFVLNEQTATAGPSAHSGGAHDGTGHDAAGHASAPAEAASTDIRFTINGAVFPEAIEAREGDVEVWTFRNDSEMDHPMHLHGTFFRVLDVDGVPPEHTGWKDTVNVPGKKALRLVVRHGEPGRWLYHCHIFEHAERGMTGELHLLPAAGAAPRAPQSAPSDHGGAAHAH